MQHLGVGKELLSLLSNGIHYSLVSFFFLQRGSTVRQYFLLGCCDRPTITTVRDGIGTSCGVRRDTFFMTTPPGVGLIQLREKSRQLLGQVLVSSLARLKINDYFPSMEFCTFSLAISTDPVHFRSLTVKGVAAAILLDSFVP